MSLLLEHRERLNVTQEELALKSGVSARTIQRIEAGAVPKGHTLEALSTALGVEKECLLTASSDFPKNYKKITKFINLSSLVFIIIPLGSIVAPLVIMLWKKEFTPTTKQIVSIQIMWTILSFGLVVLSSFIKKGLELSNQITAYIMLVLLVANCYVIIKNAIAIEKNNALHIKLNFSFL